MGQEIVPQIRLITASDSLAELTALLHEAYRALAEQGMRFVASHQSEEVTARRIARAECYLAFYESQLVGTVTLDEAAQTKGCSWYEQPEVASFHQFAVHPRWQGKGIGSKMLDHIEKRATEKGVVELALDTAEPAKHLIDFYGRRGYRFVGHVRWEPVNYRSVVLSKPLVARDGNNVEAGIVSAG